MQKLETLTLEQTTTILNKLFPQWINQRPGLEFGNYGDARSYNSELRGITKQRREALEALEVAQAYPPDPDKLKEAFSRSFSGRLEPVINSKGKLELDYCTGQYWPTEYREAAGAVLREYIRQHKLTKAPTPLAEGEKWTINKIKAANAETGGTWFSRENMRFFRTRVDREVYEGPGGVFFVYSNQFEDSQGHRWEREYKVLNFDPATADTRAGEYVARDRGLLPEGEAAHTWKLGRREAHNLAAQLAEGKDVAK